MKFKFLLAESRVHDFLFFPRIVYFRSEYEKSKADSSYNETMAGEYLDFLAQVEKQLLVFRDEISEFYYPEFSSEHDFIELLSWGTGLINYKNEQNYLDHIAKLSATEIREHILGAILITSPDCLDLLNAQKKAQVLSANQDKIRTFIKALPVEPGTKWNLSLVLEEPLDYVKRYIELMDKLLPIFKHIYQPYEKKIKAYGLKLEKTLNDDGEQAIEALTYSIINPKIFQSKKEYSLLISAVSSYGISIALRREHPHLVWGLEAEEAFRTIKELNENKVLEKVTVFKNLGDKTRYEVLRLIATGVTSIKEMAEQLGVTSATISYHINNLAVAKILKIGKPTEQFSYVIDYKWLDEILTEFKNDLDFPN